jgi:hypothetical protein
MSLGWFCSKWHVGTKPEYMPLGHGFEHYLGIPYSVDMGYSAWRPNKGNFPPLPLVEAVSARPCLGVRVPGPTEIVLPLWDADADADADPMTRRMDWLRFAYVLRCRWACACLRGWPWCEVPRPSPPSLPEQDAVIEQPVNLDTLSVRYSQVSHNG